MAFKTIKKDMVNWIKKIAYNNDSGSKKTIERCGNSASRCCLTCNRCWEKKHQNSNIKRFK